MSLFMKIPGVKGQTSDRNHGGGWMDIDALHWGVGRRITAAPSTRPRPAESLKGRFE